MIEAANDLSAADWVREQLVTFAHDVGSLVPADFEAYARVLHPAAPGDVRWADIARELGRTVHREVQFQNVATPPGGVIPQQQHQVEGPWQCPSTGQLPEPLRNHLGTVLSRFTTAPERVWFALWEGYGGLHPPSGRVPPVSRLTARRRRGVIAGWLHPDPSPDPPPHTVQFEAWPRRPLLDLPNRRYLVYVGPLSELPSWRWEGPNLWWPEDRAWFVASEIDLVSTYVGGSAAAIAELLRDPLLEVLPSSATDRVTADSDRINV